MLVERKEETDCNGVGVGGEPLIKISLSHGPSRHQISVPAQSTFGHMKEVIEKQTGLDPDKQKIIFRGKAREDMEYLHEAGVKDKSKVLVLESFAGKSKKHVEMKESEETSKRKSEERPDMSKAFQAIAGIREEVDKLAERVSALKVVVDSGTKVADEEFVMSSELLMRQLLKLDTIEAEGEAKMQRRAEVRRVQNFHDVLDNLKSSNSKL